MADVVSGPWSALEAWLSAPAWDASEGPVTAQLADEDAFCASRRRVVVRVDASHVVCFVLGALLWPAADVLRLVRAWWLRHVRRWEAALGLWRPSSP